MNDLFSGGWTIAFSPVVGPGPVQRYPFGVNAILTVTPVLPGGFDFVLQLEDGRSLTFQAHEVASDPPRLEARWNSHVDRAWLYDFLAFYVEAFGGAGPLLVGVFTQRRAAGEDPPTTGGWVGTATVPDPR